MRRGPRQLFRLIPFFWGLSSQRLGSLSRWGGGSRFGASPTVRHAVSAMDRLSEERPVRHAVSAMDRLSEERRISAGREVYGLLDDPSRGISVMSEDSEDHDSPEALARSPSTFLQSDFSPDEGLRRDLVHGHDPQLLRHFDRRSSSFSPRRDISFVEKLGREKQQQGRVRRFRRVLRRAQLWLSSSMRGFLGSIAGMAGGLMGGGGGGAAGAGPTGPGTVNGREVVKNRGPAGGPGTPGEPGTEGAPGGPGFDGPTGVQGMPGASGTPGQQGQTGTPGGAGEDANDGITGSRGPDGKDGWPGLPGAPGQTGEPGPEGIVGPAGVAGPEGSRGKTGPKGKQGPAGPPAELILDQWTFHRLQELEKRALAQVKGPPGLRGKRGAKGPPGKPGKTIALDEVCLSYVFEPKSSCAKNPFFFTRPHLLHHHVTDETSPTCISYGHNRDDA